MFIEKRNIIDQLILFLLLITTLTINSILNIFSLSVFNIIFTMLIIFANTLNKSIKTKDLLQPVNIANLFLFFLFVIRPLYLLDIANLENNGFFQNYYLLYSYKPINEFPFILGLSIGLVGIYCFNFGYWAFKKDIMRKVKEKEFIKEIKNTRKNIQWINAYYAFGFIMLMLFLIRFYNRTQDIEFSTIDIIWIYIFSVSILLEIVIKNKISVKHWFIIGISIVALSILGNRQLIINLLISSIIPLLYLNKKINWKTILLGCVVLIVIVWYGSIRSGRLLTLSNFFEDFIREFSMFDMLIIGLDHKFKFNTDFYLGYNYLSIFNYLIPGLSIPFFDFAHVKDVFQEVYGGGIPTTIIGSLYFNFTIFGVVIGMSILGFIFSKMYSKYRKMGKQMFIIYQTILITFVYDVIRVGDISRELVTYLIFRGVLLIALLFIYKNKVIKNDLYESKIIKNKINYC